MCMRIDDNKMRQIISDLGLTIQYIKGQDIPVRNCWHFCSDGNAVDAMFTDEDDFRNGMNRIYIILMEYNVIILAFILMDTHFHFILYGDFNECNKFVHEYVRRTSAYISEKYNERKKLAEVPLTHQAIDTDRYLKTVICYTFRNATEGGLKFSAYDYPWSSCALEFRSGDYWTSPRWKEKSYLHPGQFYDGLSGRNRRQLLKTQKTYDSDILMTGGMVFPGEYVAFEVVERIFRTHRSFSFFMGKTRESDVESREGMISYLTLPMQEMRQHRNEISLEIFGRSDIRNLDVSQRLRLAQTLKSRYRSSDKQIARICCLSFKQFGGLI